MTSHPRRPRPPTGPGRAAVSTTLDVDHGLVVVRALRFTWADLKDVEAELLQHAGLAGAVVELDLTGMTEEEASRPWVNTILRAHRLASRSGSTLVVRGAPDKLARVLERLRIPLAGRG
jgi:hypothetical protein